MNLSRLILLVLISINSLLSGSSLDGDSDEIPILQHINHAVELVSYHDGVFLDTVLLGDIPGDRLFILVDIHVCTICRDKLLDFLKTREDETMQFTLLFSGYMSNPRFLNFIDTNGFDKYLVDSDNFVNYCSSEIVLFTTENPVSRVEKYFTYTKDNCALAYFLSEINK